MQLPHLTRGAAFWPAVIALAAGVAIGLTLDGTGDHDCGFQGPGLTVDEPFNVQQGVLLADRFFEADFNGFARIDARLPDHPPLGRLWIGACHELFYLLWPPKLDVPYSVTCARVASALAFAVNVLLAGWFAGRQAGRLAGAVAALALVLMPRQFGHAHLAALETAINLAYCGLLFYLASRADDARQAGERPGAPTFDAVLRLPTAVWAGCLLGLALLTKIQAIFLPLPVGAWVALRCARGGLPAPWLRWTVWMAIFGLVALAVFLVGWPWLWSDPLGHIGAYLGRTTNRAAIHVWYLGASYADRDVPWHYPWVLFGSTVPSGLQLLGLVGLAGPQLRARLGGNLQLLLAGMLFPLLVFSLPRVAVYDGERLFSIVFPLWSVFIGIGAARCAGWLHKTTARRFTAVAATLFCLSQAWGLIAMAPCWLGYYNALVGGPAGARRLGLQTSYWADGLSRGLLAAAAARVPAHSTLALVPTMHDLHSAELVRQSPALRAAGIELVARHAGSRTKPRFALVFPRQEYLPADMAEVGAWRILAAVERAQVVMAALVELPDASPKEPEPPGSG